MKKSAILKVFVAVLASLTMAHLITSCGSGYIEPVEPENVSVIDESVQKPRAKKEGSVDETLAPENELEAEQNQNKDPKRSLNAFGLELFKQIISKSGTENVSVSPLSVALIMKMAANVVLLFESLD